MKNKSEILNELHQVIGGAVLGSKTNAADLGLRKLINESMTAGAPEVLNILQRASDALSEGVDERLLVRPLLEGLGRYESLFSVLKESCDRLRGIVDANLDDLNLLEMYESITNEGLKNFGRGVLEAYMADKSLENRAALVSVLESAGGADECCGRLVNYLREGIVTPLKESRRPQFVGAEPVNEGEVIDYKGQKFIQDENGQLHKLDVTSMEKIYEQVDEYINRRIDESKAEKEERKRSYRDIDSNLELHEHIIGLQKANLNNPNLLNVLGQYSLALQNGEREEVLCEGFCRVMEQGFDYLDSVSEAVSELRDNLSKNSLKATLVAKLEQMSRSSFAHLVPIVEGVVVDYAENPNPQTRSLLMNHLRMYDYCPWVVEMMMFVNGRYSNEGNGYEGPLPSSVIGVNEENQFIKERAHVESVFSPVQYVKENECIFNVDGQFYVRKGANITKLSKEAMRNLSESFMALSILVNDPHVEIDESENTISYYAGNECFVLHENLAECRGRFFTLDELKAVSEMHVAVPGLDDVNYLTAAFLLENFDNIAKLDFVTRISLNESDDKSLDLFRIKKNIFVSTHDRINEDHVFYRGVTPLQLKNIVNEHFGMNVANLFEDLMPNQERIVSELNELRGEYEKRINSLLEMRQKFSLALDETVDTAMADELEESIEDLDMQIKEAKAEYRKFQKKADEIENGKKTDNDKGYAEVLNERGKKNDEDDDFSDEERPDDDLEYDAVADLGLDDEDGSEDYVFDGSDGFDEDDFTTSDGDLMTEPIGDDFETDPFAEEDGSDADFSANGSQGDDFYGTDEFGQPLEDTGDDFDISGDLEPDNDFAEDAELGFEEDPYGFSEEGEGAEGTEAKVTDAATGEPEKRTEDTAQDADLDYANFKIVKVDFDVNVRTGEQRGTGKVIVVVPWIDAEGNKTSEPQTIPFYTQEINGERSVVLDSDGMSVEMYNAIVSAVKGSEHFAEAPVGGGSDTADEPVADVTVTDDEPFDPMMSDTYGEPFDSGSDETTVITMEDNIEPEGVKIPTYSDGDTEIELPANNVPMTGNEGGDAVIDLVHESGKVDRMNADAFSHLFEDEDVMDIEDNGEERYKVVTAAEQDDPIAVIEDVLNAFADEMSEAEDADIEVSVGEIEDYDIDGVDVSSIKATIGANEYAFFQLDGSVYSCLAEDFDEFSEEIESLREFVTSGNENLADCDASVTEEVVSLVTDIISTETGETFVYDIEGGENDDVEEDIEENPEYSDDRDLGNFI